jgi:F0F1-type ATP synthase membrane subunit c/vacuolar-type H+-ATPase subunit K
MTQQPPQDPHLWQNRPGQTPQPQHWAGTSQSYVYGSPQPYYVQPIYVQATPHSGLATASLIMGILGLLIGWCTFGLPSGVAVLLGHAALSEIKHGQRHGSGTAIVGLVLGYTLVIPGVIFAIILIGENQWGWDL